MHIKQLKIKLFDKFTVFWTRAGKVSGKVIKNADKNLNTDPGFS